MVDVVVSPGGNGECDLMVDTVFENTVKCISRIWTHQNISYHHLDSPPGDIMGAACDEVF